MDRQSQLQTYEKAWSRFPAAGPAKPSPNEPHKPRTTVLQPSPTNSFGPTRSPTNSAFQRQLIFSPHDSTKITGRARQREVGQKFGKWDVYMSRGVHSHSYVRIREHHEILISSDYKFINTSFITWTADGIVKIMQSWKPKYQGNLPIKSSFRVAMLLPASSYCVKSYDRTFHNMEVVLERMSEKPWPVEVFEVRDYPTPTDTIRKKIQEQFNVHDMAKGFWGTTIVRIMLGSSVKREAFDFDELLRWMGVLDITSTTKDFKPRREEQTRTSQASVEGPVEGNEEQTGGLQASAEVGLAAGQKEKALSATLETMADNTKKGNKTDCYDDVLVRDLKRAYQLHLRTIQNMSQAHLIRLSIIALEKALEEGPEEVLSLLDMD